MLQIFISILIIFQIEFLFGFFLSLVLDFAEMVLQLELRFNVDMPISEVEEIGTVKEAVDYLNSILSLKAVSSRI